MRQVPCFTMVCYIFGRSVSNQSIFTVFAACKNIRVFSCFFGARQTSFFTMVYSHCVNICIRILIERQYLRQQIHVTKLSQKCIQKIGSVAVNNNTFATIGPQMH